MTTNVTFPQVWNRPENRVRSARTHAVDVIIVGAGHAGLAVAKCLADLGVDHLILEKGEVANRWRHERWDTLKLLTPNWMCQLPGQDYEGSDPNGFMSKADVADFIGNYAIDMSAPVMTDTEVSMVTACGDGSA